MVGILFSLILRLHYFELETIDKSPYFPFLQLWVLYLNLVAQFNCLILSWRACPNIMFGILVHNVESTLPFAKIIGTLDAKCWNVFKFLNVILVHRSLVYALRCLG